MDKYPLGYEGYLQEKPVAANTAAAVHSEPVTVWSEPVGAGASKAAEALKTQELLA